MDYEKMTAPCGLACFDCVVHLAKDDPKLRTRVAQQFGLAEEKVGCLGCRDVQGDCPVVPEKCSVFPCAQARGVMFCCDCPDFPCDALHPYADRAGDLPHNTKVFNLCLIQKMGVQAWAEHKAHSVKRTYFRAKWRM
jgi:hypothetical protein